MIAILGRYFTARVAVMIVVVFLTTFGMVFIIDLVEMLRRTADIPGTSAGLVAYLSMMRVPSASEQLMPFCVLSGAMAAFLDLSRKLELLVARAAGVSAWGFLTGPLILVAAMGLVSIFLLDPIFAVMKREGDAIEAKLLSRNVRDHPETTVWLRQKGIDGEAIIKAASVDDAGTVLGEVEVYLFDPDGRFESEVDAPSARLRDGIWTFDRARIITPGEETVEVGTYLLATDVAPGETRWGRPPPDGVPFWDLPAFIRQTEAAGLDSTAYRLQYQTLLARPLMFVAMTLVAAAFSLRFFRFGGIGRMIGGGLVAGFVLYVATKMVGDLGQTGLIGTSTAAWSPPMVGSLLATLALLHLEDG